MFLHFEGCIMCAHSQYLFSICFFAVAVKTINCSLKIFE